MMGAPLGNSYSSCPRGDGRNLVEEWRLEKERRGERAAYVTNTAELLNVDLNSTGYLMGECGMGQAGGGVKTTYNVP